MQELKVKVPEIMFSGKEQALCRNILSREEKGM
jgi:hypothetical protein